MRGHGVFHVGLNALDVGIDMAVGNENVGPAIEIVVEEKTAEAKSEQGSAADFGARSLVNEESFAFVVIERKHLIREVRNQQAGEAGVIVVGGVHAHAGTGHAVFAKGDSRDHRFFGECAVAIVAIKLVRLRVIRKQKIGPAVIVKIEHRDTESLRRRLAEAGFLRYVLESAVAAVVPEANGSAFVGFRSAIRFALAVEGAIEIRLRRPLDIVADHQVQMAVLVVVHPSGAGAEFLGPQQARFLCDIRERAVAVVVKKAALPVGGDEKIVEAVVIVVTDGHAHSKQFDVEPSLVRHVGERAVMIVVIESGGRVFLDMAGPVHAVHKKNVRPAVVVVVDEGHARSHGFRQEFLPEGAIIVNESNPGLLSDITKSHGTGIGRCTNHDCGFLLNENRPGSAQENKQEEALHSGLAMGSRPTPRASATLLM